MDIIYTYYTFSFRFKYWRKFIYRVKRRTALWSQFLKRKDIFNGSFLFYFLPSFFFLYCAVLVGGLLRNLRNVSSNGDGVVTAAHTLWLLNEQPQQHPNCEWKRDRRGFDNYVNVSIILLTMSVLVIHIKLFRINMIGSDSYEYFRYRKRWTAHTIMCGTHVQAASARMDDTTRHKDTYIL